MKLCLGREWYGTYARHFLTAEAGQDRIDVIFPNMPDSTGLSIISAKRVVTDPLSWHFNIGVPDAQNTDVNTQEEFEWHTYQTFRIKGHDGPSNGSFLLQKSSGCVVAHMKPALWSREPLSGDLNIFFLGSGKRYEGLWKIIVFVIGCCAQ